MATDTSAVFAPPPEFEEAHKQMRLGYRREASLLYWEAATRAIEETATRIGFQLSRRRLYADVCDMLQPWYPHERTFRIYSSMSLLQTNAEEDYDLGDVWMGELADDIHELFIMLEFAVSQNGHTDRDSLSVNAQT